MTTATVLVNLCYMLQYMMSLQAVGPVQSFSPLSFPPDPIQAGITMAGKSSGNPVFFPRTFSPTFFPAVGPPGAPREEGPDSVYPLGLIHFESVLKAHFYLLVKLK